MSVSKNTKKKYKNASNTYSQSKAISALKEQVQNLNSSYPAYSNSYADTIKSIYNTIKNGGDFSYSPENDSAYRRFADEYSALAGLAIEGNQAQAQGLTGGIGSSYAENVSNQGYQRMLENAKNAQPLFYNLAQAADAAKNEALYNKFRASADASNDELGAYSRLAGLYNNQLEAARKNFIDERDFEYKLYNDNRDFWSKQYKNEQQASNKERKLTLKEYDVYEDIAANKCAAYKEKMNNAGMRNYLNDMVEQGKLTGYMAENLYRKYKYSAPASRSRSGGGSGGSRSSSRGSSSKSKSTGSEKFDAFGNWSPNQRIIKYVNMNNRAGDYSTALEWLDYLIDKGKVDKNEKLYYAYYFRNQLK